MPVKGIINIEHEAVPSLNWPAMRMDFRLSEGASLGGLQVGDEIAFELAEHGEDYRIESLRKLDAQEQRP